ncbi:PREDICTED: CMRF35-like molecule 8 isoform X1 [Hipposideros armiger]|uniref:CMRF35-like molecule 8 isoform X1 n=1 Tax=Hipposideros armiger TaxID=186990 RepID=A0A8B7S1H1_HIPAR|nr:PREDICTED: CMRF35-like molecule 8 isoform X1 [Hipposideros armiger]
MTQQDRASWLPSALALLLLWAPGSWSLSGPRTVTGTVGESLSVQCQYEEEFTGYVKYWSKYRYLSLMTKKIVETTESEREVRRGRVSIRDDPANLTFTVTLDSLTKKDDGTYECGINKWGQDPTFLVEVSVFPASTSAPPANITRAKTSTITAQIPTVPAVRPSVDDTVSANSQENEQQEQQPSGSWGLHVALSLLAFLLLLLGGTLLLAWKMARRRIKAGENLEPLQNPGQAAQQSELCYAHLELPTWPLHEEPVRPRQVEVEYSTVGPCMDEPYYTSVLFHPQSQDSKDKSPARRPRLPESQYTVIRR